MRKYRNSADSPTRIDYGVELLAGLGFFMETASLAPSFKEVNDELDAAYTARRATRKPLLEKRATFRFAHYNTDQTIRMVNRAAEIADGGRKGPLVAALFPQGLGPVVAPYGTRQIKPTEELVDRLTRCKLPGAEAFRNEWKPKLDAALSSLTTAADALKAARDVYLDAFRSELALREEHYFAIDKLMGLVRAAFPRDRARQDLVFPLMNDGGSSEESETSVDEGDEDPTGGEPGAGGEPGKGGAPT